MKAENKININEVQIALLLKDGVVAKILLIRGTWSEDFYLCDEMETRDS